MSQQLAYKFQQHQLSLLLQILYTARSIQYSCIRISIRWKGHSHVHRTYLPLQSSIYTDAH